MSATDALPPRRVLMTGDTVGGVWTYCLELAAALSRRGVDVALATMGGLPSAEQRAAAARVPRLELHASAFKLEWMDDPWDDVAHAREWIAGLCERLRPDVLHANTYGHAEPPGAAAVHGLADLPRVVVAHSCVTSWWRAVKGGPAPAAWDAYRGLVRAALSDADAIVAPSAAMLDALRQEHGPLPRARVVPNGRDPGTLRPGEKRHVVLAAGRFWDEAKNLETLDRAATRLPWMVRVAGDCIDPSGRERRPQAVWPLGRLSAAEMSREMAQAAVFASPARYEPFGLAILEAALCGCALVLADIPSLRELWSGCARFVPADDDAALAAAIAELMRDDAARLRLARRALERATRFGTAPMVDGILDCYAEAAGLRAGKERSACAS